MKIIHNVHNIIRGTGKLRRTFTHAACLSLLALSTPFGQPKLACVTSDNRS